MNSVTPTLCNEFHLPASHPLHQLSFKISGIYYYNIFDLGFFYLIAGSHAWIQFLLIFLKFYIIFVLFCCCLLVCLFVFHWIAGFVFDIFSPWSYKLFPKYLKLTLVFKWNSALRENFILWILDTFLIFPSGEETRTYHVHK